MYIPAETNIKNREELSEMPDTKKKVGKCKNITAILTVTSKKGKDDVFTAISENTKKRFNLFYSPRLFVRPGDRISIIGEKRENEDVIKIITEPLVYVKVTPERMCKFFTKRGIHLKASSDKNIKDGDIVLGLDKTKRIMRLLSRLNLKTEKREYSYEMAAHIISKELLKKGKIKEQTVRGILTGWKNDFDVRQLGLFGISNDEIKGIHEKIMSSHMRDIIDGILDDPVKVYEMSMERCDHIISLMGRTITKQQRQEGILLRELWDKLQNGYVSLNKKEFKKYSLVDKNSFRHNYPVVYSHKSIYLKKVYDMEKELAENILSRMSQEPESVAKKLKFAKRTTKEQREAVKMVMENSISVITGRAGTGKTDVVKEIVDNFELNKISFLLCAPTGAAVERLREVLGQRIEREMTMTIHMFSVKSPKIPQYIIVDESSMISYQIAHMLLKRLAPDTRLIFIGDEEQLPPINFGAFFSQLIKCGAPTVKLTKNFRILSDDTILVNANNIISGKFEDFVESDSFTASQGEMEDLRDILSAYKDMFDINEIVVICPLRKKGDERDYYINKINKMVWEVYYPKKTGGGFQKNHRVMVKNNDYKNQLMNGQEGIITSVDRDGVVVEFGNSTSRPDNSGSRTRSSCKFFYNGDNKVPRTNDLEICFCRTVHGMQGLEKPVCLCFVPQSSYYGFLNTNLIYTMCTRARERMDILGDLDTITRAVKTYILRKGEGLDKIIYDLLEISEESD